jgi:hypothetical protein
VWDWDRTSRDDLLCHCAVALDELALGESTRSKQLLKPHAVVPVLGATLELKFEVVESEAGTREGSSVLVTVVSAGKLPKADLFGGADPYCKVRWVTAAEAAAGAAERKTRTIMKTLTPSWQESFTYLRKRRPGDELRFEVWDYDRGSADDLLCHCAVPLGKLQRGESALTKQLLKAHTAFPITGAMLELEFEVIEPEDPAELKRRDNKGVSVTVTVASAGVLPKADLFGGADPYCKVRWVTAADAALEAAAREKHRLKHVRHFHIPHFHFKKPKPKFWKTRAIKKELEPDWDERLELGSSEAEDQLVFEVFDHDLIGKDELLGLCVLDVSEACTARHTSHKLQLLLPDQYGDPDPAAKVSAGCFVTLDIDCAADQGFGADAFPWTSKQAAVDPRATWCIGCGRAEAAVEHVPIYKNVKALTVEDLKMPKPLAGDGKFLGELTFSGSLLAAGELPAVSMPMPYTLRPKPLVVAAGYANAHAAFGHRRGVRQGVIEHVNQHVRSDAVLVCGFEVFRNQEASIAEAGPWRLHRSLVGGLDRDDLFGGAAAKAVLREEEEAARLVIVERQKQLEHRVAAEEKAAVIQALTEKRVTADREYQVNALRKRMQHIQDLRDGAATFAREGKTEKERQQNLVRAAKSRADKAKLDKAQHAKLAAEFGHPLPGSGQRPKKQNGGKL